MGGEAFISIPRKELMMNRFLVVLVLLVIAVVGLGFYMGWFRLSSDQKDEKTNINLTIDEDKFRKDKDRMIEKVQEAGESVKEKTKTATEKVKDKTSQP
jgi:hypothetical protein